MGKIIGIDLGTTNSAVAIFEDDQAKIYENAQGKRTTPSIVALKKTKDKKTAEVTEEWIVGENAKRQAALNPLNTLYGVKRLIGRRFDDAEVSKMQEHAAYKIVAGPNGDAWVEVNGKPMAPAEISAKVLRELKDAVEKTIGEPVTQAVITVPAYFNDAQRKATRDAGAIAGLEVLRIVNEPTAAALAYGMDKKQDGKIVVYDLGGGTFDVSVLQVMHDKEMGSLIQVLSTNGDTFLGGENFDERVTEHLVNELHKEHGTDASDVSPQVLQRLREAAEKAKIELSRQDVADISLPFLLSKDGEPINFETHITRKQLEGMLKGFVDQTIEPCKKALADAGLKASDIDEVILVGGQTRMPLVVESVKGFFGKEPRRDVNPDEIVAMGASVQGAILSGAVENVLLQDVIPLSIGIRAKGGVMDTLIERNTAIPTERKEVYSTAVDMQKDVHIKIYQGERPTADDNKLLGDFVLDGLPPAKAGTLQIEVALSIDADGVLKVEAHDLKSGRKQHITIKANGGLSEEDVARMLKDADANAEKDRLFKASLAASANADHALKEAADDEKQEWFASAPQDLKKQFNEVVTALNEARVNKDVSTMLQKTEELKNVRLQIGESFNASASTAAPAAAADVTVETTVSQKPATPPAPPAL